MATPLDTFALAAMGLLGILDPFAQQAYFKPAAVTNPSQDGNFFGHSVAASGDTIVIGAPRADNLATQGFQGGAAYVFVRSGATWIQQARLLPAAIGTWNSQDWFGWSVAISGNTIVVGAINEDSNSTGINSVPDELSEEAGAAYVFVRNGTTWTQQAYLKPGEVGASQALDRFGYSVAVSGDIVAVGAKDEDSSSTGVNSVPNEGASFAGAAYVFARTGSTWSQEAYLKPGAVRGTQGSANFGWSVAASGSKRATSPRPQSSYPPGARLASSPSNRSTVGHRAFPGRNRFD
jgi:hypothetical protein